MTKKDHQKFWAQKWKSFPKKGHSEILVNFVRPPNSAPCRSPSMCVGIIWFSLEQVLGQFVAGQFGADNSALDNSSLTVRRGQVVADIIRSCLIWKNAQLCTWGRETKSYHMKWEVRC